MTWKQGIFRSGYHDGYLVIVAFSSSVHTHLSKHAAKTEDIDEAISY